MSTAPATTAVPSMDQVDTCSFNDATTYVPVTIPNYVEPSYSPASWNNIPAVSYSHNVTAPPTPEDPPKVQQPMPVVVKEEPYLEPGVKEEEEEEGDILIGLGLYDPPEKLPYEGGLLGASFEPKGKGLKLEDAWEPPASDDEEDGEGEAEEEDDDE